jgi:hypothetical protein
LRRDTPEPARQVTYRRHLRPSGVDVGVRTSPGADQPDDAGTLPAEPARRPAGQAAPLPLPLLSARVTPGIVATAVATDAGDGPPDVDALTERVAQRRFGEAIPRRVRASLFRGVQLLLDRSPAMAPFERDVTELARLVRLVVGHDVEEVSFAGRPQDVLPGPGTPRRGRARRYWPSATSGSAGPRASCGWIPGPAGRGWPASYATGVRSWSSSCPTRGPGGPHSATASG